MTVSLNFYEKTKIRARVNIKYKLGSPFLTEQITPSAILGKTLLLQVILCIWNTTALLKIFALMSQ